MPPYDAQATRRRLLDAAVAEFAEYGIAGARVDRIAEAAKSNKAQIYHYFGGKTQLFDAVFQQATMEMEAAVPFDPHDLPGYAGRLARLHERRPEIIRICTWQRLERADGEPSPLGVAFARSQVEVIAEAQQTGKLPAHFAPGFLLGLVLHIATGWAVVSPEYAAAIDVPDPDERVRHIENAIRQLLGQPSAQPPGSRPNPATTPADRPAPDRPPTPAVPVSRHSPALRAQAEQTTRRGAPS